MRISTFASELCEENVLGINISEIDKNSWNYYFNETDTFNPDRFLCESIDWFLCDGNSDTQWVKVTIPNKKFGKGKVRAK